MLFWSWEQKGTARNTVPHPGQWRTAWNRWEQCSGAGNSKGQKGAQCISCGRQQALLQGWEQLRKARDRREHCSRVGDSGDNKGQGGTLCPSYRRQQTLFQSRGQLRTVKNRTLSLREHCSRARDSNGRGGALFTSYGQQKTLFRS